MTKPEFLTVGYVTLDQIGNREQFGGSCLYSANAVSKLGIQAAIWTSCRLEDPSHNLLENILIARSPSNETTTFAHEYDSLGNRKTSLKILAAPMENESLPEEWKKAPCVFMAPNWQECTPETLELFETSTIGLALQGWFRSQPSSGYVAFGASRFTELPKKVKLIVVSEEDVVHDARAWDWIRGSCEIAVKTAGNRGHLLAFDGEEIFLKPPYVVKDVDPTGAGDVFASMMLLFLYQGCDPVEAAQMGSIAASFVVEKPGLEGLANREALFERLRASSQQNLFSQSIS